MYKLSSEVRETLYQAGWSEKRQELGMEEAFKREAGEDWNSSAAPFVRSLGGLVIRGVLWIEKEAVKNGKENADSEKMKEILRSPSVCIAFSNAYNGCFIWVDALGRFFAIDSQFVVFVGDRVERALEVLLGDGKLPSPPAEIADKLNYKGK